MKKWFVFGYDQYYPSGGMNGFLASFLTREEADEFVDNHGQHDNNYRYDYYDVVDITKYM